MAAPALAIAPPARAERQRLDHPLRLIISAAFLLRCSQSAATVLLGFYLAHLSSAGQPVTAAWSAVLLSSSYGVEILLAPSMGALSDRFGRKPFIAAAPVAGVLGVLMYLSGNLPALFAGRALEGLAAAALTPAVLGYVAEHTAEVPDLRTRTMAYFEIAVLVGNALGLTAGGILWQRVAEGAFQAPAALYLVGALLVGLWLPSGGARPRAETTSIGQTLALARTPRVLSFLPAWLCMTAVIGLWANNIVFQLAGARRPGQLLAGGLSGDQVSSVLAAFTLTLIVGTLIWARSYRLFKRKTSSMLLALAGLMATAVEIVALNHVAAGRPILLVVLALSVALESGFTPVALAYIADITEGFPADRGAIMGLYSIVLGLGQVLGGSVGGPFAQAWGLDGMAMLTLALGGIATATVVGLRRER